MPASSCVAVVGSSADDGAMRIACAPVDHAPVVVADERAERRERFVRGGELAAVTVGGFGWMGSSVVTIGVPLPFVSGGAAAK